MSNIALADIFQSGMVLQRGKKIRIWGETDSEQKITVLVNGSPEAEGEFAAGTFELYLSPREAATDNRITVKGLAGDKIVLEDVDFGEVWIAGGQSNMEFQLCYDAEGKELIAKAGDEHLRFYDVARYAFAGEREEGLKDDSCWDTWLTFTPHNAGHFSAVGLYFARRLRERFDVPVGIVGCNWGGTTAAAWTDEEFLKEDPELQVYTDQYAAILEELDLEEYKKRDREARETLNHFIFEWLQRKLLRDGVHPLLQKLLLPLAKYDPRPPMGPNSENRPGGLYHNMLQRVTGFTCRGVIWYQGESDTDRPRLYSRLFTTMINCWRRDWEEELPFLFVQLAPYHRWLGESGDNFPALREEQEWVNKNIKSAWMVSIMDAGMKWDIHPKEKRPVGERLALLAAGKIYGEDILCQPPEFAGVEQDDNRLILQFSCAGEGLFIKGESLQALRILIQEEECEYHRAKAERDRLVVELDKLEAGKELEISFAREPYCEVNLYSSVELPAKPFTWRGWIGYSKLHGKVDH